MPLASASADGGVRRARFFLVEKISRAESGFCTQIQGSGISWKSGPRLSVSGFHAALLAGKTKRERKAATAVSRRPRRERAFGAHGERRAAGAAAPEDR